MAVDHDALRQWSQLHDDYDVERSRLVRSWLRAMHVLAAPVTRAGIPPTAVTIAGVATAGAAARLAAPGRPRPEVAALVLATAVCDGVDGAVALQRISGGRPGSRHGATIDHAADRATDLLFAAALARAGASRRVSVAAASATVGYEVIRSLRRRTRGVDGLVTVGERPIRVVVVCAGLMAAPGTGAAIVAVLSAVAVVQVLRRT